jgi:glucan phosphoethanolaminetransferase (alkaline phosphatase superfamily)
MMSVTDRIESMLGALGDTIEKFSDDRMRVIVGCSLAAGLSIPVAWFGFLRISVMWRINTPSWAFILTFALVCVSCYMAAALLLILAKAHRKFALSWLFVVALGSFILAVFADVWGNPEIWRLSTYDLISVPLRDALERTVWLSLFTLPFAALVKYSGGIVRAVKRWHSGRDYALSILGK